MLAQFQQQLAQAQHLTESAVLSQLSQGTNIESMHASMQTYAALNGGHDLAAPQSTTPTDLLRQITAQGSHPSHAHDLRGHLGDMPPPHHLNGWNSSHQALQDLFSSLPQQQALPFSSASDLSGTLPAAAAPVSVAGLRAAAAAAYAAGSSAVSQAMMLNAARDYGVGSHLPQPSSTPGHSAPMHATQRGRAVIDAAFLQGAEPSTSGVPLSHAALSTPPPDSLSVDNAGAALVLVAKILTESDMKHSRAILPRIAVENNLPFLLGYRTFGLEMPDADGEQWEFTVKSWANGRADRAQTERRKDRRVYVVEQMAKYLNKHQLQVGDVIGIVASKGVVCWLCTPSVIAPFVGSAFARDRCACGSSTRHQSVLTEAVAAHAGQLEMHHSTAELKAWIERPTYGPASCIAPPTAVPGKCSVLEEIPEGDTTHRQCQRSAKCSKPNGHPGFCVGANPGPRPRGGNPRSVRPFRPHACVATGGSAHRGPARVVDKGFRWRARWLPRGRAWPQVPAALDPCMAGQPCSP
jgi:hypothetical protein